MNDPIDYRMVRRRVEEQVKKQKQLSNWLLFGLNVFLYVLFVLIACGIYLSGDGHSLSTLFGSEGGDSAQSTIALFITGWLMSLIFHGVSVFLNTKMGEQQIRDKVIARELGRELLHLGPDEEPYEKRKRMMQLADDGEMREVDADEEAAFVPDPQSRNRSSSGSA